MKFKFVGQNTKLRLTYDREIWFPFQKIRIPNKLNYGKKQYPATQLLIDSTEKFKENKFKFGESFKTKKDEIIIFRTYKLKFMDLFHLKNLSGSLPESCIDIDKKKFKLSFNREYIFHILFDSKKNMIYLKTKKDSPAAITILILPVDFEELEFEYV